MTDAAKERKRLYMAAWQEQNRERINARRRERRRAGKSSPSENRRRKGYPGHDQYLRVLSERQKAYRLKNKDAMNEKRRAYREMNKEKIREQKKASSRRCGKQNAARCKEWAAKNPERVKTQKLKQYGLSIGDYDAMLVSQNHACAVCLKPETARHARTGRLKDLSVDHDHATGGVRGLLCASCNLAIGSFNDDIEILARAISYLNTSTARFVLKIA